MAGWLCRARSRTCCLESVARNLSCNLEATVRSRFRGLRGEDAGSVLAHLEKIGSSLKATRSLTTLGSRVGEKEGLELFGPTPGGHNTSLPAGESTAGGDILAASLAPH